MKNYMKNVRSGSGSVLWWDFQGAPEFLPVLEVGAQDGPGQCHRPDESL